MLLLIQRPSPYRTLCSVIIKGAGRNLLPLTTTREAIRKYTSMELARYEYDISIINFIFTASTGTDPTCLEHSHDSKSCKDVHCMPK